MKANDLRNKSKEELLETLKEVSKEQFNLKIQKSTGSLSKPDLVKKARRNIARIHTILAEKAGA